MNNIDKLFKSMEKELNPKNHSVVFSRVARTCALTAGSANVVLFLHACKIINLNF